MNRRFQFRINFSSSYYSDYEYDYSYDEDSAPLNEKPTNIPPKGNEKLPVKQGPFVVAPPRAARSDLLRPIPKKKPQTNTPPRPQTPDSTKTPQIHFENASLNEKNISPPESTCDIERFYTIEMKRKKSPFGSKRKRFLMMGQSQIIYDLCVKSKEKVIKLPNKHHLEISKGCTEFRLKSNNQFQKELLRINYEFPYEKDECKRKTCIRFINKTNISLPSKLVSLPGLDDDNFRGHYFIPSVRNTAFAVQGDTVPVLTILEQEKDRIEIRTNLNIDKETMFVIGMTSFLCKINCGKKTIFKSLKSFSLASTVGAVITHESIVV